MNLLVGKHIYQRIFANLKKMLSFIGKTNDISAPMDFHRIFDILPYQQQRFPYNAAALSIRQGEGWQSYDTANCLRETDRVSAGLLRLGIQSGDKVAITAHSGSPRWNFFDLGAQQIGAVVVPLHATSSFREIEYILREAGVRVCLAADATLYERVLVVQPTISSLEHLFCMEKTFDRATWDELVCEPDETALQEIMARKAAITPESLATIIYTSGTTGDPKGVMLSHHNIVSNVKSVISLIPVNYECRVFSFLPLSHIFERMVVYTYMAAGTDVYYPASREAVLDDLRAARPHYFTAVPKVLERVYQTILEETDKRSRLVRRLVRWAIRLGEKYNEAKRIPLPGYWVSHLIADLLVYRLWRRQLGGSVEGIAVGAAALQPKLGRLFSAAGIRIREGYGLTETSPVVAFNRFEPGGVRFGTVGIPVPGVKVKIDQPNENGEGEILVQGPNVMLGYYKKPDETAAVLSPDGWLHTGDVGKFVHKRFLCITDRQKDIFKTTSGMYVAPQLVEQQLQSSMFIEQCIVAGFNQSYVVALILPDFNRLQQWCKEHKVHWTAPQYMVLNPKVLKKMEQEIEFVNESLASHQRVRRFHLLHKDWSEESGELTPTLKVKRVYILQKYRKEVEAMYD